ncbi:MULTISPECIES: response regulator [Rhizobium]|uniref:response regulator n=1 Tax=Rhizobium TaxID=379 RepID=UPI00289D04B0
MTTVGRSLKLDAGALVFLPHPIGRTMADDASIQLLLVEDDHLLRLDAEELLIENGFEVASFASAEEAIAALDADATQFSGVITDIRLGKGASGWQVGRHARQCQSNIPVVYVTADSASEWTSHGVPNSVLIQKPFVPAQLISAISGLLNDAGMANAV